MIFLLNSLQLIFRVIFCLPPKVAIFIIHLMAKLIYRIVLLTPFKRIVQNNLNIFFPDRDTDNLANKTIKNASYLLFEVISIPFFKEKHFNILCKVNGIEHIDLALSKRKGVIIISMHTANYELLPIILREMGYSVNSILKAPKKPLFEFLKIARSYKGVKLINILETNMYRESLRCLRNNEIICLAIDTGALEGPHEKITFLGKQVPVATGWLTLAQRSSAEIILVQIKREDENIVFNFSEPFTVHSNNREKIINKTASYYENFIKNHPENWLMFLNEYETKRMVEGD